MPFNMMFEVFWYQITSAQLPFPTSRALSAIPASGALLGANSYYNDPMFAGIYIRLSGSGGSARWTIECTEEMTGKKFKIYVNFGNNWYVYELQVWGPGSYTINNPGTGPALPNQIIFGEVVPIFEDFPPNERDPAHPPPTFNPFEPIVTIETQGEGPCSAMQQVKVTLATPANVVISQATVTLDGVAYPVSLPQLLAGYTFTQPGDYELVIIYTYSGNAADPLVQYFSIPGEVYPHVQAERTYGGVIPAQTPVVFDNVLQSNGSINCDPLDGQIEIYFCGVFLFRWFVVPQLGLTTDGDNLAIVGVTQGPQGSGHVKVSPTSGFAILEVDAVPYTAQLLNTSDGEIDLSDFTQAAAGLLVMKIGDIATDEGGE